MLIAEIHKVTTGEHDQPKIHFSLHDEEAQQVSFLDTIGLAHASYLVENEAVGAFNAYAQMLHTFVNADDAIALVGATFKSEE